MKSTARQREAEMALGTRSRHQAEEERKLVDPARLDSAITEFIEWRTFAYWVRLVVETEGGISTKMQVVLDDRCRGFTASLGAYSKSHPNEREFLWLRLIEWIDNTIFESACTEGWRHALGFYATRDPRLDRVRQYWLHCDDAWKAKPPAQLPSLHDWRQAAQTA